MTPIRTQAPTGRKDRVARSVREAMRRSADRAHRYRPESPMEALAFYGSRQTLLRHINTLHNHDNQVVPVACMSDKELRLYHEQHLHRFDRSA